MHPVTNPSRPPTGRILARSAVVAVVLAGCLTIVAQPAAAVPGFWWGHAYVWANNPTSTIGVPYTPSLSYQFSSTSAQNTVTRLATGSYAVRFPFLGPYGTALVTAYGGTDERCKISYWTGVPGSFNYTDTMLYVRCYTRTGSPVNTRFTASYNHPGVGDIPRAGYLWNDQPGAPLGVPFTPSLTYQYNSEGSPNTIVHLATGDYEVRLTGLGTTAFTPRQIHVTAYGAPAGDPSAYCNLNSSPPHGAPDGVYWVSCFTATGARIDSRFVLTYVENNNHIMASVSSHPTAATSVNCAPEYTGYCYTGWSFDTNPSADITTSMISAGQFAIHMPVPLSSGTVQVTSYWGSNPSSGRCKVAYWNSTSGIRVSCFENNGAPAIRATFNVGFVD